MRGNLRDADRAAPAPGTMAACGLGALAVAMGIGRFAFTPILPMMQEDTGLTVAQGGWLAAANYVGYLVGALSALVVRLAPATAIRAGLCVTGIATFGMGLTHGLGPWLLLRALAGVASAWVLISVSAWCVGRLAPLGRPLLDGAVFAGVGLGMVGAGLVCLLLTHGQSTAATAWMTLGAVALAVTAVTWRVFGLTAGGEERRAVPDRGASEWRRWDGEWTRMIVAYGAFGFGYIIPATFVPAMARHTIQNPWVFGWAWPVFGAAAAASTMLGAVSARASDDRRRWRQASAVMAVAVALPAVVPGMTGIVLAAVGVGGTFMVITMMGMREAKAVAGPDATRLMAAMTAAFALGQIGGPLIAGALGDGDGGFDRSLLFASGVLAVAAGLLRRHPGGQVNAADVGAARC